MSPHFLPYLPMPHCLQGLPSKDSNPCEHSVFKQMNIRIVGEALFVLDSISFINNWYQDKLKKNRFSIPLKLKMKILS